MLDKTHEGKWLLLTGITVHGKNRIREHGDGWLIEKVEGCRALLRSRELSKHRSPVFDRRWIDLPLDKNFNKEKIVCG